MSTSKDSQSKSSSVVHSDASMKGKGVSSIIAPITPPDKKGAAVVVSPSENSYVALGQLSFGMACTVRVMVYRKWESTDLKGKPISTDYIVSDEQGGVIHCTAWSGIAHRFTTKLEEGNCCTIKGFTVKPNKDKFRVRNSDKHCIQLEGNTVVKNIECDSSLFQRYPFQLTPFEDIALNGSTFLLDVIGIVIRIGQINPTRNNSQLLDIHIQNERGRHIRVTLWGSLCHEFVERNAKAQQKYILILPDMHVKEWKDLAAMARPLGPQVPREGTLLQLLHLGREQKEDNQKESITLHCKVKIENVRTKFSWYYFSCAMDNCKKGVSKVGDQFWCDSCLKICE